MTEHWTVCQVFSKRTHLIRDELEKGGRGTFTPLYTKRWYTDGKPSEKKRQLMPGYLFVKTGADWGTIRDVEGVIRVLANNGRASPVRDDEMERLTLGHATGAWNEIERAVVEPQARRPRKPRPSKRVRRRLRAQRSPIAAGERRG